MIRAVEMAIWQRQGDWSVILHSARGSQFTSADYQRFLNRNTLVCSRAQSGIAATTLPLKASLVSSNGSVLPISRIELVMKQARADLFAWYIEEEEWPSTAPSRLQDTPYHLREHNPGRLFMIYLNLEQLV